MKYLQTLSSPCFIQVFRTSTSTSRAVSPAPVSRWRVSLAASQTGTGALRQAEPGRQAAGQADRQAGTKMSLIIRRRGAAAVQMVTTQPPATWTPGMLGTALADNLLSVFIETIDLSVRKRGKNKNKLFF